DDPGVEFPDLLVSEPEPSHRAGQEVLDDDIGAGDEIACLLESFVGGQVDGHRLLVAVHTEEVGRLVADPGRSPVPGVVPEAGSFDLDDLRPEVGEQHGGVGAGEHATEVGDHQPLERTGKSGHRKAASPVRALPMVSWWTSEVPS